jgi:hypothetical protein
LAWRYRVLDDAVNAAVAGLTDGLAGVGLGSAIPHRDEELHDEPLEEARAGGLHAGNDVLFDGRSQALVARLERLLGRLFGSRADGRWSTNRLARAVSERLEFWELQQVRDVDPRWLLRDHGPPAFRDPEAASPRALKQARGTEVGR